nr:hypothetical protein [Veillonella denticariosi]
MNTETYNAGFITYVAILSMTFLLLVAFTGLHIGQICESNTMDELHLEEAHYAAERGAHWFVGYCKSGNGWDFNERYRLLMIRIARFILRLISVKIYHDM